jgi:hypothetical protein
MRLRYIRQGNGFPDGFTSAIPRKEHQSGERAKITNLTLQTLPSSILTGRNNLSPCCGATTLMSAVMGRPNSRGRSVLSVYQSPRRVAKVPSAAISAIALPGTDQHIYRTLWLLTQGRLMARVVSEATHPRAEVEFGCGLDCVLAGIEHILLTERRS